MHVCRRSCQRTPVRLATERPTAATAGRTRCGSAGRPTCRSPGPGECGQARAADGPGAQRPDADRRSRQRTPPGRTLWSLPWSRGEARHPAGWLHPRWPGLSWWPGTESNRRPCDFQAQSSERPQPPSVRTRAFMAVLLVSRRWCYEHVAVASCALASLSKFTRLGRGSRSSLPDRSSP